MQFHKMPKLYWIRIEISYLLYNDNIKFRKLLDDNGYKYIYYETDEGHIWKNWIIYLTEFSKLIFK